MNELLIILAISVIIIGFLILVGVAIWLAMERRRLSGVPTKRANQPAAPRGGAQGPAAPARAATPPAAAVTPDTEGKASDAPPKEKPRQKEVHPSGEYPSAALYDQTLLPQPPKRGTKPQSK
jgi:hypothetical protein